MNRTKTGLAMRAVSYDHNTARLMGINVDLIISVTFGIGSALAGAGGVLYGIAYPQINPFMGVMPGLKAFVRRGAGRHRRDPGAMLGADHGAVETITSAYVSSTYRDAIAFVLLIVVLLWKATGIMGKARRKGMTAGR